MGNEEDLLDHLDAVAGDQRPPKSPEADCSALYCLRLGPSEEDPETMVPVIKAHHSPVCISNGLAWSSDNQTMFFVDSCQRKIFAFDFDAEQGTLSKLQWLTMLSHLNLIQRFNKTHVDVYCFVIQTWTQSFTNLVLQVTNEQLSPTLLELSRSGGFRLVCVWTQLAKPG